MELKIILGIVIVSLLLTIFVLQMFLQARRRLQKSFRQRLGEYQLRVIEYQKRLSTIEPYASDYMNSLPPDTARALLQLRRMMMAHQRLLEQLHQLLLNNEYEKYPQAIALLDRVLSRPAGAALTGRGQGNVRSTELIATGDDILPTIPGNWELQAESLLQEVGQDLYRASEHATEVGLPKNRRRRPTLYTLGSIGIIRPPDLDGRGDAGGRYKH